MWKEHTDPTIPCRSWLDGRRKSRGSDPAPKSGSCHKGVEQHFRVSLEQSIHICFLLLPLRKSFFNFVAGRVAEERGALLGHEVGYCIRFDDCTDPLATRIKFLTDGMLVREMMVDPLLTKYSAIMLDEAHERTLYTDIAIGLLKKIQRKRGDLRLIVASATLDAEKFRDFFNQNETSDPTRDTCVILTVEGRTFPVDIFYLQSPVPDYIKSTVETVMKIHQTEGDGDILAFLTGQEEVETVVSMLIEQARALGRTGMKRHLRVLPMYAGLPSFEQMKVFERVSRSVRKVIVATNVAETSITISGIVYVIDCGFVKLRAYNPRTAIECLVVVPVSQASANQRAGRGGRSRSGKCYRLYTEEAFDKLPQCTVPEMQRSNLAPVILQLKALGIDNVLRFHFMSPPPAQSMVQALELLYALGGLDKDCRLTEPLGMRIAEFPLNPMFAKMLLESGNFGCSQEILSIAAMMQIQNIFVVPSNQKSQAMRVHRKFAVEEGDHLTMLNVYEAFIKHNKNSQWCQEHFLNYKGLVRAATVREQLKKLLVKFQVPKKSSEGDPDPVLRCLVSGFFANAARFHSTGAYRTIRDDHELHIHPASVLYAEKPPRWVIYNEVIQTSKYYMRDVTAIESAWLLELAPHFYQQGTKLHHTLDYVHKEWHKCSLVKIASQRTQTAPVPQSEKGQGPGPVSRAQPQGPRCPLLHTVAPQPWVVSRPRLTWNLPLSCSGPQPVR
uniref:probable ATP-dependent RNA helicase DHX35 isoform X2 n=1 Tax=Panthera onca TaxID=9690 RepID=UPI002952FE19|nr:probable ATP-dependent RNA helicase DHX35 isoform X2 [Panthera onca]